jgi:uncharacterized protein YjbJ (UPF0337 family)
MKLSTRYQTKGLFRIARGTFKKFSGTIRSNTKLEIMGRFERLAGRVQWKIGKVQGMCGL